MPSGRVSLVCTLNASDHGLGVHTKKVYLDFVSELPVILDLADNGSVVVAPRIERCSRSEHVFDLVAIKKTDHVARAAPEPLEFRADLAENARVAVLWLPVEVRQQGGPVDIRDAEHVRDGRHDEVV